MLSEKCAGTPCLQEARLEQYSNDPMQIVCIEVSEVHLLQLWRLHMGAAAQNDKTTAKKITWILGDADAAQFLSGEDDRRDALVELLIAELWEDALGDLCQHSTCTEACQNLSHCKDNHQRLQLVAVLGLLSSFHTEKLRCALHSS